MKINMSCLNLADAENHLSKLILNRQNSYYKMKAVIEIIHTDFTISNNKTTYEFLCMRMQISLDTETQCTP